MLTDQERAFIECNRLLEQQRAEREFDGTCGTCLACYVDREDSYACRVDPRAVVSEEHLCHCSAVRTQRWLGQGTTKDRELLFNTKLIELLEMWQAYVKHRGIVQDEISPILRSLIVEPPAEEAEEIDR